MSDEDAADTDRSISLLGRFYENLDLLAPGDNTLTKEAFHRILPLPSKPRILDIGCGAGRTTLVLAEACPEARIDAVDTHQPFLAKCEAAAKERGFKITTHCFSMDKIADEIEEESVDLIWSEGAAYIMGFEAALKSWRDVLDPDGAMVVSELCWLTDNPPEEALAFWREDYPDMTDIEETISRAKRAGFSVFDTILLPDEAWEAYYGPLEARMDELEPIADEEMASFIRSMRREVDIFRRYKGSFGYVLFLMRWK